VLPIVTVAANMVHFFFGLPILVAFLLYFDAPITGPELLWFPVAVAVQLVFTLGCALILAALTVHFRDIRDILGHLITIWFFATPIIYPYMQMERAWQKAVLNLNPMSHLVITYQEILFFAGPVGHWKWLLVLGATSIGFFLFAYWVFDRLRDTFAEEV
jgi:lipopolysaccharide transport system permease protein